MTDVSGTSPFRSSFCTDDCPMYWNETSGTSCKTDSDGSSPSQSSVEIYGILVIEVTVK